MQQLGKKIYCDFNALRPFRKEVKEEILSVWDLVGNPSSIHAYGRKMRDLVESSRRKIAELLKLEPGHIVFCSGATEANNFVLSSFKGPVIVSSIEHPSILDVRRDAHICSVNSDGVVSLEHLEQLLKTLPSPALVCVMAANNETGVIQPIDDVASLVHMYGGVFHCDVVQALGRMPICWRGLDSFAISGLKLGGPFGVGILGVNPQLSYESLLKGGGQERGLRAGTENVWGIVGIAKAIELALQENWQSAEEYRDWMENYITTVCEDAIVIGNNTLRLPNTSLISMPNIDSQQQLIQFDLHGIAVSNGSACNSGKIKPSYVLANMGIAPEVARGCVRISFGPDILQEEIQFLADTWCTIHTRNNEQKKQKHA